MTYHLSIVIPVWNKYNFTRDCLRDLLRLQNHCEVIVVDNGSTDETQAKISSLHEDLHKEYEDLLRGGGYTAEQVVAFKSRVGNRPVYERLPENRGFAVACNRGYKIASAPNVLFLNNDIRVRTDFHNWTDSLIKSANEEVLAGPTVGHLTPNFHFVREDSEFSADTLIDYLSGWCLAGSKKVFDKLVLPGDEGPFSTEFGLAYFEDTDLSMRAQIAGMKLKVCPVPVHHFGKVTSKAIDTSALYSKARGIFLKKWAGKLVLDNNDQIMWGAIKCL